MKTRHLRTTILVLACGLASIAAIAATPPDTVNYQGVLRNAADEPLDGLYDMQFRFFSAETGGDYILMDRHDNKTAEAVMVSDGLFTVPLGTGTIVDGNGPGTYTSLSEVFRDYSTVFLEIHIGFVDAGPEVLSPRVPIQSSSFALNADHLDGVDSSQLMRRDSSDSFDSGTLTFAPGTVLDVDGSLVTDGSLETNGTIRTFGTLEVRGPFVKTTSEMIPHLNADYLDDQHASSFAAAGHGHEGSEISGTVPNSDLLQGQAPAFFLDTSSTSQTKTGSLTVENFGTAVTGISSSSSSPGGYFENTSSTGYANLGAAGLGISASGSGGGGYFESIDGSSEAWVAGGDDGIYALGNHTGGLLSDRDSSGYAYVGYSTYKIQGSGIVSFVQNHPEDPDRVIVYAAPEGDEAATYTRGTARLVDGYARIPLGETFKWVTNPDLGLTAHVTPRDECNGLMVESIATDTITVRELNGGASNAAFDYIVYGLRIGFEEVSIVQEKQQEARIPSMKDHRDRYAADPSLRRFNALDRYRTMEADLRGSDAPEIDLSRSRSLRDKIEEFDPTIHGPVVFSRSDESTMGHVNRAEETDLPATGMPDDSYHDPASAIPAAGDSEPIPVALSPAPQTLPVVDRVRQGELLVIDPAEPGLLRRSITASDPRVIGIALSDTVLNHGRLNVALQDSRIATVWADASYGEILAGDLLVTSPTPGHAMAGIAPPPGAVFAKALEPLESGTGLIQVVMTSR